MSASVANPSVAVSMPVAAPVIRAAISEGLGGVAEAVYLADCIGPAARVAVLQAASALLGMRLHVELAHDEWSALTHMELLQTLSAGVDFLPFDGLPAGVPVAANRGAYADPMAEHGLAMVLAALKDLRGRERKMRTGHFVQWAPVGTLRGKTVAIVGYGGIGRAFAQLLEPFGCRVVAINRAGSTPDAFVDRAATLDQLPVILEVADVVVLTLSLNHATRGVIDAAALARMADDAILLNLARGALIDEAALYAHLVVHPRFVACLDAWWSEPFTQGRFETGFDFFALSNVLGSPHNSAQVPHIHEHGARLAAENIARTLGGAAPWHLVGPEELR
ncbi:MAG: NAD(P)-dependent oxidoreductase [Verrucomicrobiia bacterium]